MQKISIRSLFNLFHINEIIANHEIFRDERINFIFFHSQITAHVGGVVLQKDRDNVGGSGVITGVERGHFVLH